MPKTPVLQSNYKHRKCSLFSVSKKVTKGFALGFLRYSFGKRGIFTKETRSNTEAIPKETRLQPFARFPKLPLSCNYFLTRKNRVVRAFERHKRSFAGKYNLKISVRGTDT